MPGIAARHSIHIGELQNGAVPAKSAVKDVFRRALRLQLLRTRSALGTLPQLTDNFRN